MNRQQLFSSFALASTTAVLATQPVRAENMQVTKVRLNPTVSGIEVVLETPSSKAARVSTSRAGEKFVANIFNTQVRFPKGKTFHASNPTNGITDVTVTPVNANSVRVTVIGKANAPIGKMLQSDKGLVFSLEPNQEASIKPRSRLSKSEQQRINSTKVGQQRQNTAKPAKGNRTAQATPPAPTSPGKPAPTTPAPVLPTKPLPTNPDVRTQTPLPPNYLNPNPNPLQFPTKPEEVQVVGAQPITLQQAIDLALRNNRQIQIQQLNLEASQAGLRATQAAKYPTLSLGATVNNSGSNVFTDQETNQTGTTGTGLNTIGTTGTGLNTIGTTGTGLNTIGTTGTGLNTIGTTGTGVTNTGTTGTGVTNTGTTGTTGTGVTNTGTTGTGVTNTPQAQTRQTTPEAQTGVNTNTGTGVNTNTGTGVNTNTGTVQTTQSNSQSSSNSATALSGQLTLSYNLYTSGSRRASIRAAEEQLRFNQLDLERASEDIRLNVATQYYDLQQADENVRIQRSAVANAQASLRDAQALEQAGVGTRFDVLQAQVQLAQATQSLTNALSDQRIARSQLATLLSIPESVTVVSAEAVEIAGLWNLSLPQSIVLAYQNRAELRQQLAQRNIYQQQRRAALARLGPQVDVSANYGLGDTLDDGQDSSDYYRLLATASLLLYDGGEARATARRYEAQARSAEFGFAQQREEIRFAVEQAYSQLQSNFENIQTTTVALEQAREALRLARLRFQAGVGTQTDVIQAEDDLTASEGQRVNAILSYNRALASLQRAISSGKPL